MPSRNVVKEFASDNYYHVYNRGVAKQPIFKDTTDMEYLLTVLSRHLDPSDDIKKANRTPYRKFNKDLELLCYCLMDNHFHFLFYLRGDSQSISLLMQSIMTAYTMYFNKKYKRVGTLFQGVFKASRISDDSYLLHITRYIHLNPNNYKSYPYSSLAHYNGVESPIWLKPGRILAMFEGDNYLEFVEDYESQKEIFEEIKHELANS